MTDNPAGVAGLVYGMREAITAFRDGALPLDRLAWELRSRIAALGSMADDTWADELKETWNDLEVVNAVFIESGRDALSPGEIRELDGILKEFEGQLDQRAGERASD